MIFRAATDLDEPVLDEVIDTYVDWREQSRRVWLAYERWSQASAEDVPLRFAAYLAELDQEQRVCDLYKETVVRTAAWVSTRNG